MKYSKRFTQDWEWYLSIWKVVNFDGKQEYDDKQGNSVVQYDKNGVCAKEAFYYWECEGKIKPTNEPEIG